MGRRSRLRWPRRRPAFRGDLSPQTTGEPVVTERRSERDDQHRIDRREALKKAAVAGGIVWSAPLITTSPVAAQTAVCTLKCAPEPGNPDLSVFTYCDTPGAKWAEIRITKDLVTCPCGGDGTLVGDPVFTPFSGNPTPQVFDFGSTATYYFIIIKGPGAGALGQGLIASRWWRRSSAKIERATR